MVLTTNEQFPLANWQNRNWDPTVGTTDFDTFCSYINAPGNGAALAADFPVDVSVVNFAKYSRDVSGCYTYV